MQPLCKKYQHYSLQKKKITFTFKVQCTDDEPDSIFRFPVSLWEWSGLCVGTMAFQEGRSVAQSWPWPHGKAAGLLTSLAQLSKWAL